MSISDSPAPTTETKDITRNIDIDLEKIVPILQHLSDNYPDLTAQHYNEVDRETHQPQEDKRYLDFIIANIEPTKFHATETTIVETEHRLGKKDYVRTTITYAVDPKIFDDEGLLTSDLHLETTLRAVTALLYPDCIVCDVAHKEMNDASELAFSFELIRPEGAD